MAKLLEVRSRENVGKFFLQKKFANICETICAKVFKPQIFRSSLQKNLLKYFIIKKDAKIIAQKFALFKLFDKIGDMIVLTGPSAFKICQQLTEDSKNGDIQYVFTANSTPLLLYDALQRGKRITK